MKNKAHNPKGTGKSLNLILWLCFSLFALMIVIIYAVLQSVFLVRNEREKNKELLYTAGHEVIKELTLAPTSTVALRRVLDVAGTYGVSFDLIYEDGSPVYPELSEENKYPELAQDLSGVLADKSEVVFTYKKELSYGARIRLYGKACYLLLTIPSAYPDLYSRGFLLISVTTGLVSVVLAFVASGFVAMFITMPVSEVTEQAKELARGNFNLNFRKDYSCSEIRELSEALDYAREEISRTDVIQKELVANVSHDFKTPLTMIKAYASMIREISGEDKEKRDAHAQIIIDECDRLNALVVDLLDLSRIRAGVGEENKTVFNLSEVVYSIAARFDDLRKTEGYQVETEVEDDLYTYACRERVEQVLYNLIGNALNYTGEDKTVRVRLFMKSPYLRFEVIDSGKGIPEEEIKTVWDRYYRSSKTHKRPVSGTGLGLSIVKSILLAQECPFGVISEQGKGSCFWVEFPVPKDEAPALLQEKGGKAE